MEAKITPIILSGGAGTRLWPMSRAALPKQLLKLGGASTMLQMTAARTRDPARFNHPVIIASEVHAAEIERQFNDAGMTIKELVLEPAPRNTAAAIGLAAMLARPEDILLVMPSDHVIGDTGAFIDAVERATPLANEGWLVTFGIEPERAETGYGYIRRGKSICTGVHQVRSFLEKPPAAVAAQLAADGQHYWNSGIFMFRADVFRSALNEHASDVFREVDASVRAGTRGDGFFRPERRSFEKTPAISVDHAIMEKADKAAVVPVSMQWSDIGSWDALYDFFEESLNGESSDKVIAIGCKDSLIQSSGPVVAAVGVENLFIIATADAVLVMPRGESQRVREDVEACRERKLTDLL